MEHRQKSSQISVRVTNKFKRELEFISEEKGMTLPDFVRYILITYLESERNNKHIQDNSSK
jgi:hypothetical protein